MGVLTRHVSAGPEARRGGFDTLAAQIEAVPGGGGSNGDPPREVLPSAMERVLGGAEARATAPELDAETEGALVHRARSGDADAWSEIYGLYYRPLFRYFLARVGDPSVTEDLTATVFLEAVKGIRSYSYNGTPLLAWLYRIARNVSADHYRRTLGRKGGASSGVRSRIPWLSRRSSDDLAVQEPAAPESAQTSINDERLDLKRALARLGEAQKEIIALHYYAGFSLREVAKILGINERRVYSMQAKALLDLRKQLVA